MIEAHSKARQRSSVIYKSGFGSCQGQVSADIMPSSLNRLRVGDSNVAVRPKVR
jgi:hypothetical protein